MISADGDGFPAAELVLSEATVEAGLDRLAAALQPLVTGTDCILLAVMTGGLYPLAGLMRRLGGDYRVDYCHATRYAGALTGGGLEWQAEPRLDLRGATVVVVDDIFDAGVTLEAVARYCRERGAKRVATAVLFVKQCDRAPGTPPPEFTAGLSVPDRYVFGCGMDLHERWRQLPAVYALHAQGGEV